MQCFDICLGLSVPPKVVITDEHGQTMQDVIGPYDEGSSVPLFCEASDGKDKCCNKINYEGYTFSSIYVTYSY